MADKTNKQKGDDFEFFSQQILLLKQISWTKEKIQFDNVKCKQKIEGKSGAKHEIDLLFTSSINDIYHLLCECKGYATPVEKSLACSFVTVINDIKKKHNDWKVIPVFFSKKGYQPGALKILNHYKINIKDIQRNFQYKNFLGVPLYFPHFSLHLRFVSSYPLIFHNIQLLIH